jgi:hypothetical protein
VDSVGLDGWQWQILNRSHTGDVCVGIVPMAGQHRFVPVPIDRDGAAAADLRRFQPIAGKSQAARCLRPGADRARYLNRAGLCLKSAIKLTLLRASQLFSRQLSIKRVTGFEPATFSLGS